MREKKIKKDLYRDVKKDKSSRKNTSIKLIAISVFIIMLLLLVIISKSTEISIFNFNTSKAGETSGLTVNYVDVDTTVLTFEYPQGIKNIKCSDGTIINCFGKTKLAMDLKIVPETEYTFEITDINNNKTTEAFTGKSSYWLTYDSRGGNNQPEKQLKINGQTLKISDLTPEPYYIYSFDGWSTNPNATEGTYQPGNDFEENEPVKLYAIWRTTMDEIDISGLTTNSGSYAGNSTIKINARDGVLEYINVPIKNCIVNKRYKLAFEFQVENAGFIGRWDYKYTIAGTSRALAKNSANNTYSLTFTATNTTMDFRMDIGDLADYRTYTSHLKMYIQEE